MRKLTMRTLDDLDVIANICRAEHDKHGSVDVVIGATPEEHISRSVAQNRLAFLWYKEAAFQLADYDTDGYRGMCKLHVGVGIRKEKEAFREVYDRVIKPLAYEQKIACMKEPINFPITSEMSVKEMNRYLEGIEVFLCGLGAVLSKPEDLYFAALGIKKK